MQNQRIKKSMRTFFLIKVLKQLYFAHANVKMLMRISGISAMASAHDMSVAPVVSTSSISSTCLPSISGHFLLLQNSSLAFSHRAYLPLCVWVTLFRVRTMASVRSGMPVLPDIPCANSSLWLYPLLRSRLRCSGTGMI